MEIDRESEVISSIQKDKIDQYERKYIETFL